MIRSIRLVQGMRHSALCLALGSCLYSGAAFAQSANGSIFGQANAGAPVTIENIDTGLKRTITADSSGRYAFSELPTGHYKVTSEQNSRDVDVNIGTGSEVNLAGAKASALGTISVTASAINPIDVSSTESTTVFTAAQIQALPVVRDITSVALLAPGTVKGDPGFGNGNLASFGGASVAENGYYVNGFDVTNIHNFLGFANLPFDAIGQEQVKTGGYGAEYGRSLGGVINIVTKRGSNDWKAGGSFYWEPDGMRMQAPNVRNPNGEDYVAFNKANGETKFTFDGFVSGPIIKDKLFVFALVEGQTDKVDDFKKESSTHESTTTPHGLVKLDWNITDHHILEFTGFSNHDRNRVELYSNDTNGDGFIDVPYSRRHEVFQYPYTEHRGGDLYVGKYTGYLTDNLTLSAQYGEMKLDNFNIPRNPPGSDCPRVLDGRTVSNGASGDLVQEGCYPGENVATTRLDPAGADVTDKRKAGRLDLEWKLGSHTLRGGFDAEKFTSTDDGYTFTGGAYWRYYVYLGGKVNGVTPPDGTTEYVRLRHVSASPGSYDVRNTAAYIEDSWQITDRWMLYGGLREETFDNKDGLGRSTVKSSDQLAPRLGFSWDVTGDATNKVFGSLGRYYIPVASNTNIRASRAEYEDQSFYLFSGQDPRTAAPATLGEQIGPTRILEAGVVPQPGQFAATSLKPMYQDELILGFQHAFESGWSAGTRAITRRVGAGMDDFCWAGAFDNWAADHGYNDFDDSTLPTCVLLNPGSDNAFKLDLNGDGTLTNVNIPASYFHLPKYKRHYNAVELFFEKQWDEKYYVQGSYTWSHDYGNSEGYVDSNFQQGDAGTTANFDYPTFTDGTNGNLPNDHRHSLKVFGAYKVTPEWMLSGNLLVQSGSPISCIGFLPTDDNHPEGGATLDNVNQLYGPSSSYCNAGHDAEGNAIQKLYSHGAFGRTPWIKNFDFGLAWMPNIDAAGHLTLRMDIFNLFNSHKAVRVVETHDTNATVPETVNSFGLPSDFQQPRYVRFALRYDFSL
jgi:hypothetical protein